MEPDLVTLGTVSSGLISANISYKLPGGTPEGDPVSMCYNENY